MKSYCDRECPKCEKEGKHNRMMMEPWGGPHFRFTCSVCGFYYVGLWGGSPPDDFKVAV